MPQIDCSGGLVQLHFAEFSLIILKKQNNRLKNEQLDDASSVRIDGECSLLILMQYLCTVSIQNGAFSGPFNTRQRLKPLARSRGIYIVGQYGAS